MMGRWGLDGMRSFEQVSVAKKEGGRLQLEELSETSKEATSSI